MFERTQLVPPFRETLAVCHNPFIIQNLHLIILDILDSYVSCLAFITKILYSANFQNITRNHAEGKISPNFFFN